MKFMIQIGKYNKLEVFRRSPHGMYLMDEEGEEVLLPNKYVADTLEIDDEIEVFIYKDSEDRLVATTARPKIQLHQFACLEVKAVTGVGAFLDWGLEKDLMVPFSEQHRKMDAGRRYVVYMYEDEQTNRLVATSKLDQFLEKENLTVEAGEKVKLLIASPAPRGFYAIINNKHWGLVYANEIFQPIRVGDEMVGYIKHIREDKKIDLSLQQQGFANVEPNAQKVLQMLKRNDGFLPLHDKSHPDMIQGQLGMSKKTFKKAIGGLYKQHLIRIESDGIHLA
jgi:predicted RNA-binding protein (virulence factor B family)